MKWEIDMNIEHRRIENDDLIANAEDTPASAHTDRHTQKNEMKKKNEVKW